MVALLEVLQLKGCHRGSAFHAAGEEAPHDSDGAGLGLAMTEFSAFGFPAEWLQAQEAVVPFTDVPADFATANPISAQALANYAASPVAELPVSSFRTTGGLLFAGVGSQPRGLWKSDKNNFAPRLGAIWDPSKEGRSKLFVFGISYAVASLSCTLPVFLTVVANRPNPASGALTFVAYALGMSLVLMALSVALALARGAAHEAALAVGETLDRVSMSAAEVLAMATIEGARAIIGTSVGIATGRSVGAATSIATPSRPSRAPARSAT